ncbi:MAG: helix-turn-helix domain-containing protein [Pseudochelatococcus sp.]|uniref:AraC-like ligand-binding domain-containing protein n=1 Tax=Pseudochelatococcus sp. TaxID=2020869 RepID=UPI003D8A3832
MRLESYSTVATAPPERAAHWSTIIADTYFPLHLTYRDPETFQGQLERRTAGPVALSRLRTEPGQYERRSGDIRQGETEDYLVTIPRMAPVLFHQLGRDVNCDPGGFILERGDEPYRFSYKTRNDLLVMKVTRRALTERLRQPDRFCAMVFNGREGLGGLFVETVRRVHAMSRDAASPDSGASPVLGRQLVELLALTLDRQAESDGGASTLVRATHLERAQSVIKGKLTDPGLSPGTVAETCGISKRYLHDLFNEAGTSVAQYIRECRLHAARGMLQLPGNASLAMIAYQLGFGDQSQFSRQFRTLFGQTPSSYRKSCRDERDSS